MKAILNPADENLKHSVPEIVYGILDKLDSNAIIISGEGVVIFANKNVLEATEMDRESICGHKIYEVFPKLTSPEQWQKHMKEAHAAGGTHKEEHKVKFQGKIHYYDTTLTEYSYAGSDRYLYLSKDITDIRQTQMEILELNTMLKKIIDNIPMYLFVKDVDDDFRYIIWNKSFAEYSKIPAEKVIGRTDFDVFPDYKDAQQFRNDDMNVVRTGEMSYKHETYMAADGSTRIVQTYKTIIPRLDRGPLLVGMSLDITNIQGIEEELVRERLRAEESDRLKSRFLANMSHEIRTPLNAIVGFAGMLDDAEDEETRRQFLKIINDNTELLLQLINDIIDLSKIEAGTLNYTRSPMDLYEMCRNLQITYKDRASEKGVDIYFDNEIHPNPFIITEDRNRIMQVMDNLLNNAVKFTNNGEIHYGYLVNDNWVEVYVSDTGKGIPKAKQEEVFDRFVKLDNFVPGTGLGLSICKLIVETLGGKMTLVSEEGQGSTFSFTIPYHKDRCYNVIEPNIKKPELKSKKDSGPNSSQKSDETILIAEDVQSNFLVVKTMIKGRYNLIWARNGYEAVDMAQKEKPDLILMDIKMPEMNGLDATRAIREFDKDVPIVALTANAFDDDREIARQTGMNNFLPKPVNKDAFEAILAAYLSPV